MPESFVDRCRNILADHADFLEVPITPNIWHVISLVIKDIAVINIGFLNPSSLSSSLQQLLRPSPSSL
jgi:hypothetical protein